MEDELRKLHPQRALILSLIGFRPPEMRALLMRGAAQHSLRSRMTPRQTADIRVMMDGENVTVETLPDGTYRVTY